jgi:hypothetical protein
MKARYAVLCLVPLSTVLLALLTMQGVLHGGEGGRAELEYVPTPGPSEPCDTCEPNNSTAQACGPLEPSRAYNFYARCTSPLDDDLYYIDLDIPGTVTMDLTGIPPGRDYSVYLYDENKNLVCYAARAGNQDEHVVCDSLQPGRYYVRVYPWVGCSDIDPYTLSVAYPIVVPTPIPPTPDPICNKHVDDFGDSSFKNDLGLQTGTEVDPPGCGTLNAVDTGSDLSLTYDLTQPGCTARYTSGLSLDALAYEVLSVEVKGDSAEGVANAAIGLRDAGAGGKAVRVGDVLDRIITDTWQVVNLPLVAFSGALDLDQLDHFFVEFSETQGQVGLDRLRLERALAPLIVDNFNDLADPNAIGGGTGVYKSPSATLEAGYVTSGTFDGSAGSLAISYTLPAGEWALWETYLSGIDVSDYTFLSFYVKGSAGGERINLYLADGSERAGYADVEQYARAGAVTADWSLVSIPLSAYPNLDLTDVDKIKFTFEWETMTGVIYVDNLQFVRDQLLADSFCDNDPISSLNGYASTFFAGAPCTPTVTPILEDGALRLGYDVSTGTGCFAGYFSKTALDYNLYRTLTAKVKGKRCAHLGAIGIDTASSSPEKITIRDYLHTDLMDEWQEISIPLLAQIGVTDWPRGSAYVVAFEHDRGAQTGTLFVDDVRFETRLAPLWVDNFDDEDERNALRGSYRTYTGGAAQIVPRFVITESYGDLGAGMMLDYAVPAGQYAVWETELRGVDLSGYERLAFRIKGALGGEKPNIYLADGSAGQGFVNVETYAAVSTSWREASIPLEDFGSVDLTQVNALKFAIEWEGTAVDSALYLDDIHFVPPVSPYPDEASATQVFLPIVSRDYRPLTLDPAWDFETGLEGWTTYRSITTSRAAVDVMTTTFRSRWKSTSLAMILNLVGADEEFDRGVTYVDLPEPTDLACKPVSCWVYVPISGLCDADALTYARLCAKDVNDKDESGTLAPVQCGRWYRIELRPSTQTPPEGWMEPGFDPGAIVRLGVQVRTDGQQTVYRGKVYVDACGWQEIDP